MHKKMLRINKFEDYRFNIEKKIYDKTLKVEENRWST